MPKRETATDSNADNAAMFRKPVGIPKPRPGELLEDDPVLHRKYLEALQKERERHT